MARDRTARARIRQLLASEGPISDPSGFATGLLKEHVDYKGTAVAFIQLIAAMEEEGEITRDIRGKRTYKISATSATKSAFRPVTNRAMGAAQSAPMAAAPLMTIDYEKLAKALLQELWSVVTTLVTADAAGAATAEAEDDVYARRIVAARNALDELFSDVESRAKAAPSKV
jgi:hypothetical protein